jgi:hypothetical protein
LLIVVLAACQANAPPQVENNMPEEEEVVQEVEPTDPPEPTAEPTPEPPPDQSMYLAAWMEGPHDTYDVGHGPNTWCARCHSPQNWDPEAIVGPPPACITCKFPTDEEIRIAPGNDLVSEEDWVSISCNQCHEVDENGTAGKVAWLNPISMQYQEVNTTTELCEKCHVTTTGNAFGSGVDHKITLGGSAHLNYGGFIGDVPPPQYCTDCHDPHTTVPKECADCHDVANLDTHIMGKNFHLAKVSCIACHDSAGYDVGPPPDDPEGMWTTQETTMGRGGPSTDAVISHSPTHEVLCNKCHFAENPWGLTEYTEDGQIPEPEEDTGSG